MLFLDGNSKFNLEKGELINLNDDYESSIIPNKHLFKETKISNGITNSFSLDSQSIVSEEINEDNIYYIKYFKDKGSDFDGAPRVQLNNLINLNQRMKINSKNDDNDKRKNKLMGRKKINSGEKGFHCRDSFDNKLRKIKHVVLQEVRVFLNSKIKEVYKLKKKSRTWELKKINPEQANKINILYNREFIHKSLKEIFSVETTIKNDCKRDFNKKLIEKLLNDKKEIFEDIFDLSFLDISHYIIGKRPELIQLNGLNFPEKLKIKKPSDKEYITSLIDIIENFEERLKEKKPRNKKKKNS